MSDQLTRILDLLFLGVTLLALGGVAAYVVLTRSAPAAPSAAETPSSLRFPVADQQAGAVGLPRDAQLARHSTAERRRVERRPAARRRREPPRRRAVAAREPRTAARQVRPAPVPSLTPAPTGTPVTRWTPVPTAAPEPSAPAPSPPKPRRRPAAPERRFDSGGSGEFGSDSEVPHP